MGAPIDSGSTRVTANAQGVATASIGPVPIGQLWRVDRTSVESDSAARCTATVYRGAATIAPNQIDKTRLGGGNGDSTDAVYRLRAGESVTVQWTTCTVGARCSFSIQGEREK